MLYIILVLLLMNFWSTTEETNKTSAVKFQRKKTFASLVFSKNITQPPSDKKTCKWLSRLKYQNKLCNRRRGLAEVLTEARNLAVKTCEQEFQYEQWNCSNREFLFKKMYRETAFMYSITSSAVMFSITKACSEGILPNCKCAEYGKRENSSSKWQWGGCGDNTKFAKRFTKRFFNLRKKGDVFNMIINYNTEIGIKVVLDNEEEICKCHGVSGSCTVKICFKKIRSFEDIARTLKRLYHNATQVKPKNNMKPFKVGKTAKKLLYLENNLNFCLNNAYTANRHCNNKDSCATLCCARGFYPITKNEVGKCNCRFNSVKFSVECDKCSTKVTLFRCK